MKNYLKILTLLLVFNYSCNKDEPEEVVVPEVNINCTEFSLAINANDAAKVEAQLNAFFNSRRPIPTANDKWGYEVHFNTLIDQIKSCSTLSLKPGYSYAGLQADPPLATFGITVIVNSQEKGRNIFLYHTERIGGKFLFREMFDL